MSLSAQLNNMRWGLGTDVIKDILNFGTETGWEAEKVFEVFLDMAERDR
jgi:hypothetical protein